MLGDLSGRRLVEVGCGRGDNAAAFALAGATVDGVDVVHGAITIARSRWGHLDGLRFVHAEATSYLADRPGEHDVVCSIFGALSFTGPSLLRPVVCSLRPSGTLAVSVRLGDRPSDRSADEWRALVTAAGIEVYDWLNVPDPIDESPPCLIFTGERKKAT